MFPGNLLPFKLFDDDDYDEDGLYDWILTEIKDLPVCITIYEEGHEAGYRKGFIEASQKFSNKIAKLKDECKNVLNVLKNKKSDENKQINELIKVLEKLEKKDLKSLETQVEEKIEIEKRKEVKTEKDIRSINMSSFSDMLPSVIKRVPGSLIMDVLVDIFRKGKAEGKEKGKRDAKKLFKTKLLTILNSFNEKADKLKAKINELQELKIEIQKEINKLRKSP